MLLILVIYDFVRFSGWTHDVRSCMVILVIYVYIYMCVYCVLLTLCNLVNAMKDRQGKKESDKEAAR